MVAMREFPAPIRWSAARVALAVLFPLVILPPMAGLVAVAFTGSAPTYTIAGGTLTVKSGDLLSGERAVPLADITGVEPTTLHGGRRVSGTALPGFCAGRYSYPDLGTVWQVTNCTASAVVVRADSQPFPIVLTPPDPSAFVQQVRAGEAAVVTLPPASKGIFQLLALALVPTAGVTAILLSALLLFGPRRLRYTVGDGMLEVRTMYGRKRWPIQGARATAYVPTRLWRVAGAGLPGYHSGLFRESGQSTRCYATALDHAVLFEGPARVIVTPDDREGFLKALEAEGAQVHAVTT